MKTSEDEPAKAPTPDSVGDPLRYGPHPDSPERDKTLPHQPILLAQSKGSRIALSCNCLADALGNYPAIAIVHDRYDTQAEYNNPDNHKAPFGPEWEIHYKDVEPEELSVNDLDGQCADPMQFWASCGICGDPSDHNGVPHSEATGDGLTRYDIVAFMKQGGYAWRDEE